MSDPATSTTDAHHRSDERTRHSRTTTTTTTIRSLALAAASAALAVPAFLAGVDGSLCGIMGAICEPGEEERGIVLLFVSAALVLTTVVVLVRLAWRAVRSRAGRQSTSGSAAGGAGD